MAKNWAIVVGINQYRFLQPLRYAQRDAEAMQRFLAEVGFEQIFLFTDDSPEVEGKTTEPFRNNLLRVLRQVFEQPFMRDGDNFWFFFSGHGIRSREQDYLMPLDGDPEDVEGTGISTHLIANYLRSCGADNAVMLLDACRSEAKKSGEGIGRQTEAEARQTGVISIFSCSPEQYSYELEAIEQGAFTLALLEGLGIRGRCATVERLNQYLANRVPELLQQHLGRGRQVPYTIAEPIDRSHLILMPQHASLADIATLKNDAYRAQVRHHWDLAQRLWIRVLAAASGQDMEAIEALQTIAISRQLGIIPEPAQPFSTQSQASEKAASLVEAQSSSLQSFRFEVVTVNAQGKEMNRRAGQAEFFAEDLGNDLTLEMVKIPGSSFKMGSPDTEKGRYECESPQHTVTVPSFFMGKFAITQAQYQKIMGSNPAEFKGYKRPVEQVTWNDAVEFCTKLSKQTGRTYRLPSETEWEYACRAGTTTPFHFGETITTSLGNFRGTDWEYQGKTYSGSYGNAPKGEYREQTTYVGTFPPNAFGLYDMHGNVWEWCQDHWHDIYQGVPNDGSAWLSNDQKLSRLLRGGSWFDLPWLCRSAYRDHYDAGIRFGSNGFRVVCSAPRTHS
jgi:formylglycine-generating enzyme required for sulfatase activity/uncharacterized caspase-like protein